MFLVLCYLTKVFLERQVGVESVEKSWVPVSPPSTECELGRGIVRLEFVGEEKKDFDGPGMGALGEVAVGGRLD